MPEFAQFQEEHPVLPETPVASKAKGQEAMAQAFGQVAQQAAQASINLAKEHSQAMFMHAATQSSDIMNQAQVDMIKNPSQADAIQRSTESSLMKTAQVPMSKGDRSRYDYIINQKKNSLKLQAARTDAHQNLLQNQAAYVTGTGSLMQQYSNSLAYGDFKTAKILHQNILDNGKNAVAAGVTTPLSFENNIKALDLLTEKGKTFYDHVSGGQATAAQANSAVSNPLDPNNMNAGNLTANAGTQVLNNSRLEAMSNDDVNKGIDDNDLSNPRLRAQLMNQKGQFASSMARIDGASDAYGLINSNPSFAHLQQQQSELQSNQNPSDREKSKFNILNKYMASLKTNYWKTQANTAMGFKATNEWIQDSAAAMSKQGSPEELYSSLQAADQKHMDAGIAMGETQHMDMELINPIHENIVNEAQSSFSEGGNPESLIDKMSYVNERQKSYLAKQLKDPIQSETGYSIAYGMGKGMTQSFQRQLILSQQKGRDYSKMSYHADGDSRVSSAVLGAKISSEMGDILSNISNLPDGQKRAQAFMGMAINFVKYKASSAADLTISHADDYIKEFKNQMSTGYDIQVGSNYSFNRSQHSLTTAEYGMLSHAAINSAFENVRHSDPKMTDDRFLSLIDRMNVSASFASDGSVIVSTAQGNILYSAPYSGSLLNHAKATAKISRGKRETSWQERLASNYTGI